jgi:hypothetical protein
MPRFFCDSNQIFALVRVPVAAFTAGEAVESMTKHLATR